MSHTDDMHTQRLAQMEDALLVLIVQMADTRARIRHLEDRVMPGEEGTLSRCRHFITDLDDDGNAVCLICGQDI